ncbi:protein GPR108 [Denticeps clupeoides]|uniref:GOST seven transmembrane domain-containing protein n=1 Tax=Denticeps clupeoides TaxID=299321 RepID=A0AAY4BKC0_9TELE|nr:protein GPR108-like [Denticeps clupeoides]
MARRRDVNSPLLVAVAPLLLLLLRFCDARIHQLSLKNETRSVIHLNTFGFYANATLEFQMVSLNLPQKTQDSSDQVGFTLAKSRVTGVLSYTAEETEECGLLKSSSVDPLLIFNINLNPPSVHVKVYGENQDSTLSADIENKELKKAPSGTRRKRDAAQQDKVQKKPGEEDENRAADHVGQDAETNGEKTRANVQNAGGEKKAETKEANEETRDGVYTPETVQLNNYSSMNIVLLKHGDKHVEYGFGFNMTMGSLTEGLYTLNFHYCRPRTEVLNTYALSVKIVERNPGGYLSASEIPLPRLYICMAAVFFVAAVIWVYTLMKHRYSVFKIHWLMAALAFTKSISLVFHSINFHFINTEGHPIEGWAVMYYITHLLKGALLFITLALIGTGWAFVKYILSDKEKKIFMIVIPLQVLANVAYIIIESTEEGTSEYRLWKEILFLVDLICCGAILFPVVWSIRHLQEASTTDGKAAMNLEKLKLFRHYYVMIVCYIYFTRIIAIFLKVIVPFQWQWGYEFLVEVSTLVFFVLTGFKFRPASNNPYLQLPQDEEDMEMDEVLTESGALEGISKVKKTSNGRERPRESAL